MTSNKRSYLTMSRKTVKLTVAPGRFVSTSPKDRFGPGEEITVPADQVDALVKDGAVLPPPEPKAAGKKDDDAAVKAAAAKAEAEEEARRQAEEEARRKAAGGAQS
jgi:hypothetical protein